MVKVVADVEIQTAPAMLQSRVMAAHQYQSPCNALGKDEKRVLWLDDEGKPNNCGITVVVMVAARLQVAR